MAKCNFKIDFNEPTEKLIERAKNGIISIGGTFKEEGTLKGNYTIPTKAGKITGNYVVQNNTVAFEITDKPIVVTCKKIEDELKKYLTTTSRDLLSFD